MATPKEEILKRMQVRVTCPICNHSQKHSLNAIRIIKKKKKRGNWSPTMGVPMIRCEKCRKEGRNVLIWLAEDTLSMYSEYVSNMMINLPPRYLRISPKDIKVVKEKI